MNEPIVSGMSPFIARLIRRAEAAEAEVASLRDDLLTEKQRGDLNANATEVEQERNDVLRAERDEAIRRAEAAEGKPGSGSLTDEEIAEGRRRYREAKQDDWQWGRFAEWCDEHFYQLLDAAERGQP